MRIISTIILITTLISSLSAKVPVYIVAGQSNADGRASIEEMPYEIQQYVKNQGAKSIFMSYCNGTTKNKLGDFSHFIPLCDAGNSNKCGFDAILYSMIAKTTDKSCYIIKEAKGGTAIDTLCNSAHNLYWNATPSWLKTAGIANYIKETDSTNGQSLLLQLEANIDSCISRTLSLLPEGFEIKCIIWHQGESDRSQATNYYENLKTLLNHLRMHIVKTTEDISYYNLPLIVGGINKRSRQYNECVEFAKIRLADEDANVYYLNLDDCELRHDDNLHFNGKGCIQVAKKIYECLQNLNLLPCP